MRRWYVDYAEMIFFVVVDISYFQFFLQMWDYLQKHLSSNNDASHGLFDEVLQSYNAVVARIEELLVEDCLKGVSW